jgi:hypothetical protein
METFLIVVFVLYALVFFIESYFCNKISSFYFSNGLVIYRRLLNIGGSNNLSIRFIEGRIRSGFIYNIQPDGIIYFRERHLTWWPGLALMRGTIAIKNQSVLILERLNLTPLAFLILFVTLIVYYGEIDLFAISVIVLVIFYVLIIFLVSKRRFNEIIRLIMGK